MVSGTDHDKEMYSALIIDDEYMIKQSLKKMIEDSGFFSVKGEAENGHDALNLIRDLRPDLAVTDIRMPVMDGLHLIEEARKYNNKMEFIIISGYDDFNYAKQAISLEVAEYLLKPIKPDLFIKTLMRIHSKLEFNQETVTIRLAQIKKFNHLAVILADFIWNCKEKQAYDIVEKFIETVNRFNCEQISLNEMFSVFVSFVKDEINKIRNDLSFENPGTNILFSDNQKECKELLKTHVSMLLNEMRRKHNWNMNKAVMCAIEFIHKNYSDSQLSLNKLAEITMISTTSLSKAFKEEIGKNYVNYLTEVRITRAISLLSDFRLRIYDISEKTGFSEYEHFSRVFKKHTGITPSEYRQKLK